MPDVKHSFLIFGQRPNAIFGKTRKILFIEMTKFSRYHNFPSLPSIISVISFVAMDFGLAASCV